MRNRTTDSRMTLNHLLEAHLSIHHIHTMAFIAAGMRLESFATIQDFRRQKLLLLFEGSFLFFFVCIVLGIHKGKQAGMGLEPTTTRTTSWLLHTYRLSYLFKLTFK